MQKKSVLFIFLISYLIAMSSFVLALHPCQELYGADAHGVEIDGECFNCGIEDGICPEDFGADCSETGDPECPTTKDGWWSESATGTPAASSSEDTPLLIDLVNGQDVFMVVTNTGKANQDILFAIQELDNPILLDGHDDLGSVLVQSDENGRAVGTFSISSIDDLNEIGSDENSEGDVLELEFTAEGISRVLWINTTMEGGDQNNKNCTIYTTTEDCTADADNQGGVEHVREDGDCNYLSYTVCSWNGSACLNDLGPETAEDPNCVNTRDVTCSYTSGDPIGDCKVEDAFKATYVPVEGSPAECEAWQSGPIPCPQQLKVPFFGLYGFLASMFIISIIYLFVLRKQE
jgi:hypothetical protein